MHAIGFWAEKDIPFHSKENSFTDSKRPFESEGTSKVAICAQVSPTGRANEEERRARLIYCAEMARRDLAKTQFAHYMTLEKTVERLKGDSSLWGSLQKNLTKEALEAHAKVQEILNGLCTSEVTPASIKQIMDPDDQGYFDGKEFNFYSACKSFFEDRPDLFGAAQDGLISFLNILSLDEAGILDSLFPKNSQEVSLGLMILKYHKLLTGKQLQEICNNPVQADVFAMLAEDRNVFLQVFSKKVPSFEQICALPEDTYTDERFYTMDNLTAYAQRIRQFSSAPLETLARQVMQSVTHHVACCR